MTTELKVYAHRSFRPNFIEWRVSFGEQTISFRLNNLPFPDNQRFYSVASPCCGSVMSTYQLSRLATTSCATCDLFFDRGGSGFETLETLDSDLPEEWFASEVADPLERVIVKSAVESIFIGLEASWKTSVAEIEDGDRRMALSQELAKKHNTIIATTS